MNVANSSSSMFSEATSKSLPSGFESANLTWWWNVDFGSTSLHLATPPPRSATPEQLDKRSCICNTNPRPPGALANAKSLLHLAGPRRALGLPDAHRQHPPTHDYANWNHDDKPEGIERHMENVRTGIRDIPDIPPTAHECQIPGCKQRLPPPRDVLCGKYDHDQQNMKDHYDECDDDNGQRVSARPRVSRVG